MIMMLSSLLYVYYVIVLVLKKRKKKLPIKASCCQNSRTIIISRDLEPVWKKLDSHQWTELPSNRLLVYKISSKSLLLYANL